MGETAGYVRVSTTKQDHNRQRDAIDKEVEGDWTIYADVGSGAKSDRADFQRLKRDIEDGQIDQVITTEISRLSRSLADASEFIDLCLANGVGLTTLQDMFPDLQGTDSVMDKMMAQLITWMMSYEREMIRGRVISGVSRAIENGKWVGRPPFGFDIGDSSQLQVKPGEFLAMQTAIKMVQSGTTQSEASERLDVPQSSLSRIINDDQKRELYVNVDSYDERIESALTDEITPSEPTDIEARLTRLEQELEE